MELVLVGMQLPFHHLYAVDDSTGNEQEIFQSTIADLIQHPCYQLSLVFFQSWVYTVYDIMLHKS